jgi:hypothetical protein
VASYKAQFLKQVNGGFGVLRDDERIKGRDLHVCYLPFLPFEKPVNYALASKYSFIRRLKALMS